MYVVMYSSSLVVYVMRLEGNGRGQVDGLYGGIILTWWN